MNSLIWKLLFRRWRSRLPATRPGYTLLLPMPGDLPFFLDIFSEVFRRMGARHLVEALVIPDQVPPGLQGRFDRFAASWPHGEVRLVPFRWLDQILADRARNPGAYHWLQLINGVEASQATHAFLHDADAFVTAEDFFDLRFEECSTRNLACLGVNPAWDHWFREQGLGHVVATWELLFAIEWLRQLPPWKHRGHEDVLNGQTHVFDTTLLLQAMTPPDRIEKRENPDDFIHFNYVISAYRFFQKAGGPVEDEHFRLLLLRLLIDAFDPGGWEYEVPRLEELERGLIEPGGRVTYLGPAIRDQFGEFRSKLRRLVESPIFDERRRSIVLGGVDRFDRSFGESMVGS